MFNTPHYGASPISLGLDVDSFARRISIEDELARGSETSSSQEGEGRTRRLSSSFSNSGRLSPSLERGEPSEEEAQQEDDANRTNRTIFYHPSPSFSDEESIHRDPLSENTPLLPSSAAGKDHAVAREELRILLGCTHSFSLRTENRNQLISSRLQTPCRLRVRISWR